jgi:uncharacterized protein YggT (Ycf19 family)
MQSALIFLVKTLADLYLLTFLLRFIMQWVRASYYNPLSQFVFKVTNPLVVPARRVLPSVAGLDTPTLVVLVILEIAVTFALLRLAAFLFFLAARRARVVVLYRSLAHLRVVELVRRSRQKSHGRAARRARRARIAAGTAPVAADRRPRSIPAHRHAAVAGSPDCAADAGLPSLDTIHARA